MKNRILSLLVTTILILGMLGGTALADGFGRHRHSRTFVSFGISLPLYYAPYPAYYAPYYAPTYVYEPPAYVARPAVNYMSITDIVDMSAKGVPDEAIIEEIRRTGSGFRLTSETIGYLKQNGVSDRVIDYMLETSR